jgi:hypothetical protein
MWSGSDKRTIGGVILLVTAGWRLDSAALKGAGIGVFAIALLLRVSRKVSKLTRKDAN